MLYVVLGDGLNPPPQVHGHCWAGQTALGGDPTGERRLAHAALGCPAWAPALLPQCPAAYRATRAGAVRWWWGCAF